MNRRVALLALILGVWALCEPDGADARRPRRRSTPARSRRSPGGRSSSRAYGSGAPARGGDAYYPNCSAARAAGVSRIRAGEPGYRPALDRDRDGIACE